MKGKEEGITCIQSYLSRQVVFRYDVSQFKFERWLCISLNSTDSNEIHRFTPKSADSNFINHKYISISIVIPDGLVLNSIVTDISHISSCNRTHFNSFIFSFRLALAVFFFVHITVLLLGSFYQDVLHFLWYIALPCILGVDVLL